jgi:prolyl-tRNA editing enzyme YbaK/EbsC (Cys-tRNA(Pro) deacylase)
VPGAWPEPVERVAAFLREAGAEARLEEFKTGTPSARAAADAAGCGLDQIVKTLVFVCDGAPVVALVPGDRRADGDKVAHAVGGGTARVARADEVKAATGFEPGGVAPFPLEGIERVLLDRVLLSHPVVWVGAGSSRHMAMLSPSELVRLTRAEAVDVAAEPEPDPQPVPQTKER